MTKLSTKLLAIAGAALFAVAAFSPLLGHASYRDNHWQGHRQQQVDPAKATERLTKVFGISEAEIEKYHTQGLEYRDIAKAAFVASASGKSLSEVVAQKNNDNTWRDVAKNLGVTKEQAKTTHHNLVANNLSERTGMDKQTVLSLFDQGYQTRDIAMAGRLAKQTGQQAEYIITLKKTNNTWMDVANSLGINTAAMKEKFKQSRKGIQ